MADPVTAAVGEEVRRQAGFDPGASTGLFVGVSTFEDPHILSVPYAVDDAVDLAHLFALELELLAPKRTVLALAGEPKKAESQERLKRLIELGARRVRARQTDVYRTVGQLSRVAGAKGLFLLSIATHGVSDQGGDFLIAADSLEEYMLRTGVAVDEIFDKVGKSPAPRRLVLLDACRERLTEGTRGLGGSPMAKSFHDAIAAASGQVVLSGATLGGYAYDDTKRGNGVFTAAILDGLRGAAPTDERDLITVGTLADFLQIQVAEWVRLHRPYGAAKSLGIGRRTEGPAESLPLAVNLDLTRARDRYRERRAAALVQLRENLGKILTGALHDRVVGLLPEEPPVRAEVEELLEEIEALDGGARSQRGLRDYLREHHDKPVAAVPKESVVVALPRATKPELPQERREGELKKPDRPGRRPLLLGLASVLLLAGVWIVASWSSRLDTSPAHSEKPQDIPAQMEEVAAASEETGSSLLSPPQEFSEPRQEPGLETKGEIGDSPSPIAPPPPPSQAAAKKEPQALAAETKGEIGDSPPPTAPPPPSSQAAAKKKSQAPVEPAANSGVTEKPASSRKIAAVTAQDGPIGMRFRFVPAGTYTIGSPKDEPGRLGWETLSHEVKLTRGLWLAETEVTQEQWSALVSKNPSHFKACGGDCPLEQVSWFEAVTFANLLSEKEKLDRCYDLQGCAGGLGTESYTCDGVRFRGLDCSGYRLPTEAEWEVAARAGTTTAIYTGDLTLRGARDGPELDPIAWYGGNSGADYEGAPDCSDWSEKQYASKTCGTQPVGKKQQNSWGLHDMLGNVWEWTWDSWQEEIPATPASDPLGPAQTSGRVIRGGSWISFARDVRAAFRGHDGPSSRGDDLGFRLARGQVRSSTAEPENQ